MVYDTSTGFLDFIHCPGLKSYNTTHRKLGLFPSPIKEKKTPTMLGTLE
jgi:hypothetical protein